MCVAFEPQNSLESMSPAGGWGVEVDTPVEQKLPLKLRSKVLHCAVASAADAFPQYLQYRQGLHHQPQHCLFGRPLLHSTRQRSLRQELLLPWCSSLVCYRQVLLPDRHVGICSQPVLLRPPGGPHLCAGNSGGSTQVDECSTSPSMWSIPDDVSLTSCASVCLYFSSAGASGDSDVECCTHGPRFGSFQAPVLGLSL